MAEYKSSYTGAQIDSAVSKAHTHSGNITNSGTLQTTDITIANGDKLVVTDSSDSSKVARTSIAFDGSTTTKALTQKGTWETFGKSNLAIGTTASTAAAGNHTHTASLATDTGTSAVTLAYGSKYKLTAGGSSVIFTMPASDNTNTTYKLTLNGTDTGGGSTSLGTVYGATTAGTSGQYLKSSGRGAPTWANFPTIPSKMSDVASISVSAITSDTSSACSITGAGNAGKSQTIIYTNSSGADLTVTVPTTYTTPDGAAIELTCPNGGYCEVNYLNIGGTIYARGL